MKYSTWNFCLLASSIAIATTTVTTPSEAVRTAHVVVAAQPSVNVWVDGGDVFPDYGQVTVWLRADRDCYSSLFMVDTAGYIHVLYPRDTFDDGWLSGGRTYCYRACDLGLDRLDGSGIAYVFAVGSPAPFDYSYYGAGVFVGGFGYRVAGDPFVACRDFYMSLLPVGCRWDYVGVGFTRFYVREWTRYPSYLCYGGPGVHIRVGDACRTCSDVYASYRCNVAAPYEVMRPAVRYKQAYPSSVHRAAGDADYRVRRESFTRTVVAPRATTAPVIDARRFKSHDRVRVVSTSLGSARGRESKTTLASAAHARAAQPRATEFKSRPERTEKSVAASKGAREKGARKNVRRAE